MNVGCSGLVREGTGIGVLQRALYPRLAARGHTLYQSPSRDAGSALHQRLAGLFRGLRQARGQYAVYLSAVPPFPFAPRRPSVAIVHDLRWQETRSGLSRLYRYWDLKRTVRHAQRLVCISERTKNDLTRILPRAVDKAAVAWLGPGIVDRISDEFPLKEADTYLLIGGASHKRNEHAAEILREIARKRDIRVLGVGVSDQVQKMLTEALGGDSCEWFHRISDSQLRQLYNRAAYFLSLGTDEGFGLPYIEALASGCTVIATNQPLTQEILGNAAILLDWDTPTATARALAESNEPSSETRRERLSKYSWDVFCDAIEENLNLAIE